MASGETLQESSADRRRAVLKKTKKQLDDVRGDIIPTDRPIADLGEGMDLLTRQARLRLALPEDIYKNFQKDAKTFLTAYEKIKTDTGLIKVLLSSTPKAITMQAMYLPDLAMEFLINFDYYGDIPDSEKLFEAAFAALEKTSQILNFFYDFPLLKNKPHAKKILEHVIQNFKVASFVFVFLDQIATLQGNPDYDDLVEKAVKKCVRLQTHHTLQHVELFQDRPYAASILRIADVLKPGILVDMGEAQFHGIPGYLEILRASAQDAAEHSPISFLEEKYFRKKDSPEPRFYDEAVFEKAARNAVKFTPHLVLEFSAALKDKPYAAELIEASARLLAQKAPRALFQLAYAFIEEPYAEELFTDAAAKDPTAALFFAKGFADRPYAAELVSKAAEKDPISFYEIATKMPTPAGVLRSIKGFDFDRTLQASEVPYRRMEPGKFFLSRVIRVDEFPLSEMAKENFDYWLTGAEHWSREAAGYSVLTDITKSTFEKIIFTPSFQEILKHQAGNITWMNALSLAQATHRYLQENHQEENDESIGKAGRYIAERLDAVKNRELFGPNTKLILFTHEDGVFSNDRILTDLYKKSGGKRKNILANEKGVKVNDEGKNLNKKRILAAIRRSRGATTILFCGHGSEENWAFSGNTVDKLDRSMDQHETTINYRELGDALAESGNIENINIVAASCLSYNYLKNLFAYLETKKGTSRKPYVSISETDLNSYGWFRGGFFGDTSSDDGVIASIFLRTLSETASPGKGITVGDLWFFETDNWQKENPTIFVGPPEQYEKKGQKIDLPPGEKQGTEKHLEVGMNQQNTMGEYA